MGFEEVFAYRLWLQPAPVAPYVELTPA
jgi:hypothetical protein